MKQHPPDIITRLLASVRQGDQDAESELLDLVERNLKEIAGRQMRAESAGHVLQTTALVNEAFLRLFRGQPLAVSDRQHFFAVAARAMRRILIDYARARKAPKRGGEQQQVLLDEAMVGAAWSPEDSIAVVEGMKALDAVDPRLARIMEMTLLSGMTSEEIATLLGLSARTVQREVVSGTLFLRRQLAGS